MRTTNNAIIVVAMVMLCLTATQAMAAPSIDGDLSDWDLTNWWWFTDNSEGPGTGYDDDPIPVFTGYTYADSTDLYLGFDVTDSTQNTNRDFLYVTFDIPPVGVFNDPDALYWGSVPANASFFGEAYLTGGAFPWDKSQGSSTWGTDGGVLTARNITASNRYYEMKVPWSAVGANAGDMVGLKVQARDGDGSAFQYVNYYPDMPDGITPIRADTRVEQGWKHFDWIAYSEPELCGVETGLTPELPPSALLSLSMLPWGIAYLRGRRRKNN